MKKMICLLLVMIALIAVVMAACSDETRESYEEAVAAYNAGNYADAIGMLTTLGEYEDAPALLATIQAEKTGVAVAVTDEAGTANSEAEYVFKDGNLIKENITLSDGTVVKNYYKYNDNDQCTSETLNHADGSKTVINHFYEGGMKVRSIRTNPSKTKDTFVYTCDENGKVISHVLTLSDGTVEEAAYTYNEQGQLTTIATATGTTAYTYNNFGDTVNKTVSENGKVVSTTIYTYIYNYFVA